MIAFVTSLRHPQNSSDYQKVESLLLDTLTSVCQSHGDFVVIVVGNVLPRIELPPGVQFVQVDFPAPAPPNGPRTDRDAFVWDKGTKIGVGLAAAARYQPDQVMIFDADDFVSARLGGFIASQSKEYVWVVRDGWMYSGSRRAVRGISEFNRKCGTCLVVPFSAYAVPSDLSTASTQAEIAAAFGDRLYRILGAHRDAVEWFDSQNLEVRAIPFRAAVYHVDTGENHSGKTLSGVARPVSKSMAKEFALPVGRRSFADMWQSFGPTPIGETLRSIFERVVVRLRSVDSS